MRYWVVGVIVLFLDQLAKYLVTRDYTLYQSVEVIPGVLWFTRVHNYGAAFGILSGQMTLLVVLSVIVIVLIVVFYRRLLAFGPLVPWGMTLALSGALGNLIDRVFRGYVVDFIDVKVWPVFNIADVAVTLGVILVGWQLFVLSPYRGEDYRG